MRKKVYEIVYEVLERKKHSDVVFHHILEETQNMEARDKKFIKRLAYGTIERGIELDARIGHFSRLPVKKMDPPVRTVLRIAMYEMLYMDSIPEAVSCHQAVELLKCVEGNRHAGFVNGVLRSFLRNTEAIRLRPWETLSLPKNLYKHLVEQYGKKTTGKIGRAFLERQAEVTLHIDTNKVSIARYAARLKEEKVSFRPGAYQDEALIVQSVEDIKTLPGYEEGWFFVQDESSMLPVLCAGISPGQQVIDVCAAPGGKSMHSLLRLKGEGLLDYRDVSARKLERLGENMRRMGYKNCQGKVWDGTKVDECRAGEADVVLADVPCSGIGIIGKKPEIKYHAMREIDSLLPIQRKICEASLSMLRKGGVFLYSTCTISYCENQGNVTWLEENCGLQRESLDDYLPEVLRNKMTASGMLQMLPGIHESDGFFLARLRKV